jgi:signal transduction histidine kinase
MHIDLVSEDADLSKVCQEVLRELPGTLLRTVSAVSSHEDGEPDLYIWDFQPNVPIPEHISRNTANVLFLIHRKDLNAFRTTIEGAESNILLKPATRRILETFLSLAVSTRAVSSLRADRDEILQCLIQTTLKLQEYDQDRTNFLARVLHDFRAPLTALNGYCGLLLGEQLGSLTDNQKEVIQRMQNSAMRLSRMASAMFQLSVGRQVKKRPDLQRGDIRKCLDQALHEIAPFAAERRINILPEFDPCETGLYFEPGQMDQVFVNILDNACRFTPKGGSIEIRGYPFFWERRATHSLVQTPIERRLRVTRKPNSYRVDILDSGALIPEEHLNTIFEEYTSYSGGRDRSSGGLGLAICRMIISQHNGKIWAENTDRGPMFSFVLPMQRFKAIQSMQNDTKTA